MMGIEDSVEETSFVASPTLQTYSGGGSSPLMTISWTRFDSRTSAGSRGTPAMLSVQDYEYENVAY